VITVSANPTTLWPPNGKMVPVTDFWEQSRMLEPM
jgi:hypothetical protein